MRTAFTTLIVLCLATVAAAQNGNNPRKALDEDRMETREKNVGDQGAGGSPNAIFAAIDSDGDGIISKVELKKAIAALKKLDADNDGSITLAEAGGEAARPAPGAAGDPVLGEINRLMANDRNNDGKLTPDEVPPQVMPLLQNADANNDRAIDRRELAAAMQNAPNQFRNPPGGGAPLANGGAEQMTGQFLKQYDRNNDGKLSSQELPASMRRSFQAKDDLDNDGAISPAELQAVMARMGGAGRAWAAGVDPSRNQRGPNRGKP